MDDLAKKFLAGHESAYDQSDWAAMEAMLDKDNKRPIVFWWRVAGIAAAIATLVLVSVLWLFNDPAAPAVVEQPTSPQEKKEAPAPTEGEANATASTKSGESLADNMEDAPVTPDASAEGNAATDNTSSTNNTADNAAQEKPLHWLVHEDEAVQDTGDDPVLAASTSSTPNGEGAADKDAATIERSTNDLPTTAESGAGKAGLPVESSLIRAGEMPPLASASLLRIEEPSQMVLASEDPLGRQFADAKGRYVQPFAGTYAMAHWYGNANREFSYAMGARAGVELWNNFSLEMGLGYHEIQYTESGEHDTVNSRIHLATQGRLTHIEVPTLVTYHLNGNAKWDGYLTAGVRHLFIQSEHYHFHYHNLSNTASFPSAALVADTIITYDVSNTARNATQEDLSSMGLNSANTHEAYHQGHTPAYRALGYLGAGIAYHVTPGFTVEGGVQYQFSLQPLGVEARDLNAYGLSLGLKYRL